MITNRKGLFRFLAVDYQGDFCAPFGRWYKTRSCHEFINQHLIPFFASQHLKVNEIVSDYRLPRPNETVEYCIPGTPGYESHLPLEVKNSNPWIKSMNSPAWSRENGGAPLLRPGEPFPNPHELTLWLNVVCGSPAEKTEIILFGLTLDCCVLATAQELYFRGYKVRYLVEGVDTYNGIASEKQALFATPLSMWGTPIGWQEVTSYYQTLSLLL